MATYKQEALKSRKDRDGVGTLRLGLIVACWSRGEGGAVVMTANSQKRFLIYAHKDKADSVSESPSYKHQPSGSSTMALSYRVEFDSLAHIFSRFREEK